MCVLDFLSFFKKKQILLNVEVTFCNVILPNIRMKIWIKKNISSKEIIKEIRQRCCDYQVLEFYVYVEEWICFTEKTQHHFRTNDNICVECIR
jgi:hypothetical protein